MKVLLLLLLCGSLLFTSCGPHFTIQRFNQLSMLKKGMPINDLGEDFRYDDKIIKFEIKQDGVDYSIVPVFVKSSRISIVNFGGGGGASRTTGAGGTTSTMRSSDAGRNNGYQEVGGEEFYLIFDANQKLIAGDFLYRLKYSDNTLVSNLGRGIEVYILESMF
jgi:hypothetical protein